MIEQEQEDVASAQIAAVRAFNRFYTRQIGALSEGLLDSTFSLTEARILYELAHRDGLTASLLARALEIDAGYLSRCLRKLEDRGLLVRQKSETDQRQSVLALTGRGREEFAPLESGADAEVSKLLIRFAESERRRLVEAMRTVRAVLGPDEDAAAPYLLRAPEPGDLGFIIHRQARLYHDDYGLDQRFEGLIAGIVSAFVDTFDPVRERAWVAERHGAVVGSIFCMKASDTTAKLRLLYVEPSARGLGIGRRLVEEVIRFARAKNYQALTLWTNDVLDSARRIYEAAGFVLVEEENHHSFGQDLVGQNWTLAL